MSAVRFLVDGDRIRPDQSPEDLDMEDGDTIEVMMYHFSRSCSLGKKSANIFLVSSWVDDDNDDDE